MGNVKASALRRRGVSRCDPKTGKANGKRYKRNVDGLDGWMVH